MYSCCPEKQFEHTADRDTKGAVALQHSIVIEKQVYECLFFIY